MDYPKISVITTCFNKELYVRACIESVLASQYPNLEYIIVDDHSTDASWTIICEYSAVNERIKSFRNEVNIGDYPNRNKALGMATGDYIKFIDADDLIYPYSLHYFVHHMEQNKRAGLCLTVVPDVNQVFPLTLDFRDLMQTLYIEKKRYFYEGPTSSFIRRASLEQVRGFRESRMSGDFETWHSLASVAQVLLLPKGSLTFWRLHEQTEGGIHRKNINFSVQYFDFSISFLEEQCRNGIDLSEELRAAKTDFNRWCFFVLRSRGFRTFSEIASRNKLRIPQLLIWSVAFYGGRTFTALRSKFF